MGTATTAGNSSRGAPKAKAAGHQAKAARPPRTSSNNAVSAAEITMPSCSGADHAVDRARSFGAPPIATASTTSACDALRGTGAPTTGLMASRVVSRTSSDSTPSVGRSAP